MTKPARIFGITTNLSGTIGDGIIANSISFTNSVQTAEARDEKGKLLDLAAYSEGKEVSIDGLFVGNGIAAGSKITLGDRDYLVSNTTKNETNTDFQRGSVSATGGDVSTVIHTVSEIHGENA